MEVYALPASRSVADCYRSDMAALIEVTGRPAFPQALFQTMRNMCNAEHVTAFNLSDAGQVHVVLAENKGSTPIARICARRYTDDYWRFDPAGKVAGLSNSSQSSPKSRRWAVQTFASEIDHAPYRLDCYSSASLDSRISISEIREGQLMRVNFYRPKRQRFSSEEADRIFDAVDLLMPLIWRHDEETRAPRAGSPAEMFRCRLASVAPTLSNREREVCALVALGLTSEGIALELKIGLNTVLTYRKRAYARLKISSQNELIRMILM